MNLKNVGIIISSEYSRRVRKKSFLITTFLTPLLLGLCIVVPFLIMLADGGEVYKVKVVDESGLVIPYLKNSESIEYVIAQKGTDVAALTENLSEEGLYAVAVISSQDENGDVSVTTYSDEPLNIDVKGNLKGAAEDAVKDYKLGLYNIDDLESILKNVETKVRVNSMTLTESGDAKEDSVEMLRHFNDRTILLHMKDGKCMQQVADGGMVNGLLDMKVDLLPLGTGDLPIPELIRTMNDKIETVIVELDYSSVEMWSAIEQSYRYMTEKGLAQGNR